MTKKKCAVIVLVAGLALSACASGTAGVATPAASPTATAESRESALPTDAKSSAAVEGFVRGIGDGTAGAFAEPGSPAGIYADSVVGLNGSLAPEDFNPTKVPTGWQVSDGVQFSDFELGSGGLVKDLARNGVPLSTTVAAGDGAVHLRTANKPYETFTGTATIQIRAFRLFDNKLQVIFDVDNRTSGKASLTFGSYVIDGIDYPLNTAGNAGNDIEAGDSTTVLMLIDAPGGGGTLTVDPVVDTRIAPDGQIVVEAPDLG